MSKSSYEKFDKSPGGYFSSHRPVCFEYLITGPPNLKSLKTNMWVQPKGTMGKCNALETALNNELLSSHGHLKKGIFSPTPLYRAVRTSRQGVTPCAWRQASGLTHAKRHMDLGWHLKSDLAHSSQGWRHPPAMDIPRAGIKWCCAVCYNKSFRCGDGLFPSESKSFQVNIV